MDNRLYLLIDFAIIILLIVGIRYFRTPKGARVGNLIAAFALFCALVLLLHRNKIFDPGIVIISLLIGSIVGGIIAVRVNMIQIPAMVAFQNGAGGFAAFLISFVELTREMGHITAIYKVSGILGLIVGTATFSGSMIASGRLANKLKQTPTFLPKHNWLLLGNALVIIMIGFIAVNSSNSAIIYYSMVLIALSVLLSIVFSIRIGGADMPVLISFLNATSGLAGALCGIVIQNRLLISCGAAVASSGFILTYAMCKAMNRNLIDIFVGIQPAPTSALNKGIDDALKEETFTKTPIATEELEVKESFTQAMKVVRNSKKVVIIPGYGMALSQAQFKVAELADRLEQMGKNVKFAIHPVAGRMPGHMNVLLAEAEVDYDKLIEMDDINPEFKDTDLALVVGACDVVNPVAIEKEGTPISGMPIIMAHEARTVVVCNIDKKPGYSGVENPLYERDKTIMLVGDAKNTIEQFLKGLESMPEV